MVVLPAGSAVANSDSLPELHTVIKFITNSNGEMRSITHVKGAIYLVRRTPPAPIVEPIKITVDLGLSGWCPHPHIRPPQQSEK